jgi:methylmalonyl-CoA mutase N-terminal domain/subunit
LTSTDRARFTTISGVPIRRLYTQADLPADWSEEKYLGYPGQPPYTRGIHATGYRGKLFTMRQFSGFASPEETNQRYKYLLEHGGGGLSVAFDLPTLMGYDSDHPASEGEVGKCGVAIDSLEDMEILFGGIDLEKTTVSMTINSPASVLWAMYLVVAEKQGADWKKISGTIQNDILKEYIAQKEYIYPPAPSMRLVIDTFEFGSKFTPRFNTISISGYHIREAGSTALQELAFTLYDGVEYVEWATASRARRRRLRSAPQLLLQRAQRFFRRDRQVPRRPQDLGSRDERSLWREESAHRPDAIPHADRRSISACAAADEQHCTRCVAGFGRSSGRNTIAALRLLRRSAGFAH